MDFEDISDQIETIFTPTHQDFVLFRGRMILTAKLADGQGYLSLRSLAVAFSLNPKTLIQRAQRKLDYFQPYLCKILLVSEGGAQPHLCLNAHAVPLLLAGVPLSSVTDEEGRELLRLFLQECHVVLAEHFGLSERGEIRVLQETVSRMFWEGLAQGGFDEDGRLKPSNEDVRLFVETRVREIQQQHEEKIEQIRQAFADLRKQVRAVVVHQNEERLTPEEVGQIQNTVKTLGAILQKRGANNPYPALYTNIHRIAGVGTIERIRRKDFETIMAWLEQQIEILSSAPPPSNIADSLLKD